MRKGAIIIAVVALAIVLYFLTKRPTSDAPSDKAAVEQAPEPADPATPGSNSAARPRWSKPSHGESDPGDESPIGKAVVYGPQDFSRGEHQNVIVDGGIRLGDNASFVPRFNPKYKIFGNYISPEEELGQPFQAASINYQVDGLNNNEVIFEIRTRNRFGDWTEWREVSPQAMKEPLATQSEAVAFQFRVSLFANDAASSPTVQSVAIQPVRTK